MRLILDANIIMAALIKDSLVRKIIINLPFEYYAPDFVFEEIDKHMDEICKKSSLTVEENREVLDRLSKYIHTIDSKFYLDKISSSKKIIEHIDPKDVPYIALALSFSNDGIWTRRLKSGERKI